MTLVITPDVTPNLGSKTEVNGNYTLNGQQNLTQTLYPKDIQVVLHKITVSSRQVPVIGFDGKVSLKNTTENPVPNSRLTVQVFVRKPNATSISIGLPIVLETGPISVGNEISFALPSVVVPDNLVETVNDTNSFLITFRCRTPTDVVRFARAFPIPNQKFDLAPKDYSGVITNSAGNTLFTFVGFEETVQEFTKEVGIGEDLFTLSVKVHGIPLLTKTAQLTITPAELKTIYQLDQVSLRQAYTPSLFLTTDTSKVLTVGQEEKIPFLLSVRPTPTLASSEVDYVARFTYDFSNSYPKTDIAKSVQAISFNFGIDSLTDIDDSAFLVEFSSKVKSGTFSLEIELNYQAEKIQPDGTRTVIPNEKTRKFVRIDIPAQNPGWPPQATLGLNDSSFEIISSRLVGSTYPNFPSQEVLSGGALIEYPLELDLEYAFLVPDFQNISLSPIPVLNGDPKSFEFTFATESTQNFDQYRMYSRADVFGGPEFTQAVPNAGSIDVFDPRSNETVSFYTDVTQDLPVVVISGTLDYSTFLDDLFEISEEASYALTIALFVQLNPGIRDATFVNVPSNVSFLEGKTLGFVTLQLLVARESKAPPSIGGQSIGNFFELTYTLLYQNLRYDRSDPPTNIELA